ncbi:MAG: peptidase T [Bacilli bacterium]|nr:peptidase T [Bacilli bacterium]
MESFLENVERRFLTYVKIDTQSIANSGKTPSTQGQFDLARLLFGELKELGASDLFLDEANCLVYAKIPGNSTPDKPFGLIAHLDTATEASGKNVKPWVLKNYDGGTVLLNERKGIRMSPEEFPALKNYLGQDLVFTDGTTLLGGDDKASIAAIMCFAEYLLAHPEIPHPTVCIAFTPDEEVGGLAKDLDFKRFGAPYAYTLDGDHLGYYSYETFHALEAQISIEGVVVHPGTTKGIMKNAVTIAGEILAALPKKERPEYTEGREGFYHPLEIHAENGKASFRILIRDFEEEGFEERKEFLIRLIEETNRQYGEGTATIAFANGYRSMKKSVMEHPFLIENLVKAIQEAGVVPVEYPFRGGTDGSALSARGLPCPNLSAGYENAHGPYEFVSIQSMAKNVEILIALAKDFSN